MYIYVAPEFLLLLLNCCLPRRVIREEWIDTVRMDFVFIALGVNDFILCVVRAERVDKSTLRFMILAYFGQSVLTLSGICAGVGFVGFENVFSQTI